MVGFTYISLYGTPPTAKHLSPAEVRVGSMALCLGAILPPDSHGGLIQGIAAPTFTFVPYTGLESSLRSHTIVLATSSGLIIEKPSFRYASFTSLTVFALGINCGNKGVSVIPVDRLPLAQSLLVIIYKILTHARNHSTIMRKAERKHQHLSYLGKHYSPGSRKETHRPPHMS